MYKAKTDFHDSRIGRVKAGDVVEKNRHTDDLFGAGYLVEYKTKVVKQRPEKVTKKNTSKKKAKK
ncbi:MAG: hypothetical protein OQK29_01445 [Ignavibacteriaceae bacterium]|nr:hypothetical protein [Ignavibacteriaceae bacterium]